MMKNFVKMSLIEEGFSSDKKYQAVDGNGKYYFVRTNDASMFETKKEIFDFIQACYRAKLSVIEPIDIYLEDGLTVEVFEWIDGLSANQQLPSFSETEQYQYGYQMGQQLNKIHTLDKQSTQIDWAQVYREKVARKINHYHRYHAKVAHEELFFSIIEHDQMLLVDRPTVCQHGDFHIGNMMFNQNNELVIVDFDRYDVGDPWEEFKSIIWCVLVSPTFASGLVDGYFNHNIPLLFWRLLRFYMAVNAIGSLSWALAFGEQHVKLFQQLATDVLDWYDGMQKEVPSWYQRPLKV